MEVRVIDTTLRDGEQKAGVALSLKDKIAIAEKLDTAGIYQIEAGIPAMGGDEKKSIQRIKELSLKSKISAWNRLNIRDIDHAIECGVDVIHLSVPSSDLQIRTKLQKDRKWVLNEMRECLAYARQKGFVVHIGLEDASRANREFMIRLCRIAEAEGVEMIRYADTVGILFPERTYQEITYLTHRVSVDIGIHVHNDFGMAVANSIAALKAGVKYVDCTFGGMGERAGNCNFLQFLTALRGIFHVEPEPSLEKLLPLENEIMVLMGVKPR